mmetsp:Transcript_31809/g.39256  ORF Transcript_31809/g.39256 Transcript_31809/m.39256 type:complete len:496 (+) Transcript_31809:88-1575(+)
MAAAAAAQTQTQASFRDIFQIRNAPFDADALKQATGISGWDKDFTYFEIEWTDGLYRIVLSYIQEHKVESMAVAGCNHSYRAMISKTLRHPLDTVKKLHDDKDEKKKKKGQYKHNTILPNLGLFRFVWKEEASGDTSSDGGNQSEEPSNQQPPRQHEFYALHQAIGAPQGDSVSLKKTLILFTKGRDKAPLMQTLLDFIVEEKKKETKNLPDRFNIYRFSSQQRMWRFSHKTYGRDVESVVLPQETKDLLLEDMDDFLSEENKAWYLKHGIPYKRCYLFYGVPGSGKTSLISVLASLHERSVGFLSPTDPEMSDDVLRSAIQNLPEKAIVVLEDVDALFTRDRQVQTRNSLTFSGLLNALDGVGSGMGQIFILSTNYRDRLDPALIRNGRVDLHVKFDYIQKREAAEMFRIFYEKSTKEQQQQFADNLYGMLAENKRVGKQTQISAATLQHFFIVYRKKSIEEAIKDVAKFVKKDVNTRQTAAQKREDDSALFYS